jgi:ferric-chelate reductase
MVTLKLRYTRLHSAADCFSRLGVANMALCVFLGLKNTPLAAVTAVSHAQLNILHRIVGYTAVLLVLLHAIFYTVYFGSLGRWVTLIEAGNPYGLFAGGFMLILLMGIWRHGSYEVFYISHIVGFIAVVILTALHRPEWAKKLPIVMLFVAFMWTLDRMIRTTRVVYNLSNNHAVCYPLPDGGTRLRLKKAHMEVGLPGLHCYLWVPRLSLYQTHPFTIVSSDPSGLELVIKSHGGFTRLVHEFATEHPGLTTWASFDGPYGSPPDTEVYDKLVFVSGGSGAAYAFGVMNRILHCSERTKLQPIDFIWAVKRIGECSINMRCQTAPYRYSLSSRTSQLVLRTSPQRRQSKLNRKCDYLYHG